MTVEFDCCECGVHVIAFALDKPPEPPLCSYCLMLPGWMSDPTLRRRLGREQEIQPPAPPGELAEGQ